MSELIAQPSSTRLANDAPWEAYQRPYVRDLAYVLACPNVVTQWLDFAPHQTTHRIAVHSADFWQAQFAAYQQRLTQLDTTTAYQTLTRYLLARPSPNRLGFHFEGLFSFWLTDGFAHQLHPYETLASNLQLYSGKQTSGELDFILYNHKDNLVEHWELAIKFFMGSAPFEPSNWVGINANDNLQRKMTHMQTKQFRAIQVDTEARGRIKIDKRYGVIKGRFFLPLNESDWGRHDWPTWLTPSFPVHRWCDTHDQLSLSTIDVSTLRRAHYVEWFTKRHCYDGRQPSIVWSGGMLPEKGLYFAGDQPIVIYPRPHEQVVR
ncbi:DUF1853 family protein [Psychrobacter sp.]|uniref:DUF1853 family protein n=1 Tax=Psychrobacter sp. TaxID=56811 RepID=UPI0026478DC7|nr:DUF1853 family protein [Psychrobacter sp.]MDN6276119.1 DUF1853 family protein [Psychrobacter sp.]MDN6307485.1 DUF1853 family protein [Psychrobacter sp.]